MMGARSQPEQPFWKDDPNPYRSSAKLSPAAKIAERSALVTVIAIRIVELEVLFGIAVLFALKYPIVWIFVILTGGLMLFVITRSLLRLRAARNQPSAADIQRLAQQRTGADVIGSAIHTAGHPLLKPNQPVVLGLRGQELSFYSYTSAEPIDTINVRDIEKIQTVVFDDEHVPHTDIVDSTAQALQLALRWRGTLCTCAFRRMHKVRPVEWYHALQAAKALNGSNNPA